MVQTKVTASLHSHIIQTHLFRNSAEQLITRWEVKEENLKPDDYRVWPCNSLSNYMTEPPTGVLMTLACSFPMNHESQMTAL